ncbi:restriction endonuclease subunit S [Streptomyces sp. NPDC051014]|uniref:restriction endonuclease subunit S n=1 Tax=Streptomyces sp. NPDC051014 TaxID=3155751 RepID=UPI0033DF1D44
MASRYVPSGIPFLRSQNVKPGRIDMSSLAYIDEEFHSELVKSQLRSGDLVIVRTGVPGVAAVIPEGIGPLNCSDLVIARPAPGVDSRFLCYAINETAGSFVRAHTVGAVQQHFNVSSAKRLSLNLPSPAEQRAIVEALGALDDKIAVNERIAVAALELADAQFAGAAKELGFGPATFGSTATIVGGGTPSTKAEEYWGGEIAWTTPTDVTALSAPYLFETGRTVTGEGLENCASQLYPAQSIFMTSRATIGAFALPQMAAAVNQGFIVVLPPTEELRWWLFHEMRSRVEEMISLANGSTFLELSRKNFKAMPIRLGSDQSIAEFARAVSPLHRRAAQAAAESRTLAALRDTLLPQLMSGKLRVLDAEKIVEDAV